MGNDIPVVAAVLGTGWRIFGEMSRHGWYEGEHRACCGRIRLTKYVFRPIVISIEVVDSLLALAPLSAKKAGLESLLRPWLGHLSEDSRLT